MSDYYGFLQKLLGRELSVPEAQAFAFFDPASADRNKRFLRYNPSRPLYLNIDDEHYLYVSNHRSALRCELDMATRHLDACACYRHERGTLMLGVTTPAQQKDLNSRVNHYYIYVQTAAESAAGRSLSAASIHTDHIALIRDETPWERLCRVCVGTHTGALITASRQRLFNSLDNGLLYIVAEHKNRDFKSACAEFDPPPQFIGRSVAYPILSLDNEDGLLEIPLSTLRAIQQYSQTASQSKPGTSRMPQESLPGIEIPASVAEDLSRLSNYLEKEDLDFQSRSFTLAGHLPVLHVDPYPQKGVSFSETGVQLHALSAIVDLFLRGRKPLALTYHIETAAESPQEIEPVLSSLNKSAGLFGIPVANSCILPADRDSVTLFFISKDEAVPLPQTFQHSGDFICLLGDPNGVLEGSAYARSLGYDLPYTPPGVMTGTLAAIVDVLRECNKRGILVSAVPVGRGGLATALRRSGSGALGAKIYSERKSPEHIFIFGEPQAAVLLTLKEKHLIDLARITSEYNLTSTTIGRVSDGPFIVINNDIRIPLNTDKLDG